MPKFRAAWQIEGFGDKTLQAGDEIEAELQDVAHLVAVKFGGTVKNRQAAVLEPVQPPPARMEWPHNQGAGEV